MSDDQPKPVAMTCHSISDLTPEDIDRLKARLEEVRAKLRMDEESED